MEQWFDETLAPRWRLNGDLTDNLAKELHVTDFRMDSALMSLHSYAGA